MLCFVFNDLYFIALTVVDLVLCQPRFIVCLWFFLPALIFYFLSTSQEIGWEEHLQYDLFSVKWEVKP